MQTLIKTVKNALTQNGSFVNNIHSGGAFYFKEAYAVAVVHHEKRIKEKKVVECLKKGGYMTEEGYTQYTYDHDTLHGLTACAPKYVKKVGLMCFSSEVEEEYTFKEKYNGDYWKKIVDPGNFNAVIEYSTYSNNEELCKIEFDLRELMRSSKEVPALKVLPYVWVVKVAANVDIVLLMKHYYGENFEVIESEGETMAIGWSPTLQEVNMRYFVCPPIKG